MPAGWPESIFVISGDGPCGPIVQGVWQSLQPIVVTRYFPRSIEAVATEVFDESDEACICDFEVHPAATAMRAAADIARPNVHRNENNDFSIIVCDEQ